jgi:hypothetical protein
MGAMAGMGGMGGSGHEHGGNDEAEQMALLIVTFAGEK